MKNAIKCHQKMGGAKIGESLTMGDGVISQDILYHYKAMGWQVNSMYWSMNQRKCYSEIGNLSWKTTWLAILLHTWKISLYFTTETIVQYIFILNVELCILHPDPGLRNSIVCFGCVTTYQGPVPLLYGLQAWKGKTLGAMPCRNGCFLCKMRLNITYIVLKVK